MSNLHKDLADAQIHVPKGFTAAANDTTLTKDAGGSLVWAAGGGGAGVTSIVAGTNVSISPIGGTGAVTVNSNSFISTNIKAYGSFDIGNEYGLGNAQFNNEHKFSTDLGVSAITTISPKNMVNSSVWVNPLAGNSLKSFTGWIFGAAGQNVNISLLRVKLSCPIPGVYPATIDVCRASTTDFTLSGNNEPDCFNLDTFTTCVGYDDTLEANEVLVLSAYCVSGSSAAFMLNCNILSGW